MDEDADSVDEFGFGEFVSAPADRRDVSEQFADAAAKLERIDREAV